MDPYEDYAERYDLSISRFGDYDPQMVAFFRQVFAQNGVEKALDCACGTGQHLPLLHSLGCQITGSDVSAAMLRQAQQNLAHLGLDIPLHQADFRQLPACFPEPFDAVTCLGAIGHMPDENQVLEAFVSMAQALRPEGILVLTSLPTDCQWAEKQRFILQSSQRDFSRIFAIDYFADRACFNILDLVHGEKSSRLHVWSVEILVLLRDTLERTLLEAGFRKVDFFGSFGFSPYDKASSKSLIAVAQL